MSEQIEVAEKFCLFPGCAPFQRCVRDKKDVIKEKLIFQPGKVYDLSEEQVSAIVNDIGNTIAIAVPRGEAIKGEEPKWKVDQNLTDEVVAAHTRSLIKKKEYVRVHQQAALDRVLQAEKAAENAKALESEQQTSEDLFAQELERINGEIATVQINIGELEKNIVESEGEALVELQTELNNANKSLESLQEELLTAQTNELNAELSDIEDQIDDIADTIGSLNGDELEEAKKALSVLKGKRTRATKKLEKLTESSTE